MPYPVPEAEIDLEVRRAIAKALRKDEGAVGMDDSVTESLGGTSLDFLDIQFRLEQAFGLKMPHNMLIDQIEELFGEGKGLDGQGRLTADAKVVVGLRIGDDGRLAGEVYGDEVTALVTPRSMAGFVKEILAQLPAACGCGKAWKRGEGVKLVCSGCGKPPAFPDGDTLTQQWLQATAREKRLFGVA
ncbi:MAG: acyl carrier protein [Planctomycetia bacterium]